MGILKRNRLSFLTHLSPLLLFYTPCKSEKNRYWSAFRRHKIGTFGRSGWNYKLFMLIFTKLRTVFFKKQHSVTASRFLSEIKKSLLHRLPGVPKQTDLAFK